jgi:hypothetical protein
METDLAVAGGVDERLASIRVVGLTVLPVNGWKIAVGRRGLFNILHRFGLDAFFSDQSSY